MSVTVVPLPEYEDKLFMLRSTILLYGIGVGVGVDVLVGVGVGKTHNTSVQSVTKVAISKS